MRRAPLLLAALSPLLGCEATAPGAFPEARGTYSSTEMWKTVFTYADGVVLDGADCSGSITVERQDGGALHGSFVVGGRCQAERGEMAGQIDGSGRVTLDLRSAGAYQTMLRCTYVSGDRAWTGQLSGDTLSVRLEATLDCPPADGVHVVRTGKGPLYPGTR
jgi:hypothetical protein